MLKNFEYKKSLGQNFINDDNIYNIDIDRLKHFRLRYTFDIFIKIPMVLYIIRSIINNYMHV